MNGVQWKFSANLSDIEATFLYYFNLLFRSYEIFIHETILMYTEFLILWACRKFDSTRATNI